MSTTLELLEGRSLYEPTFRLTQSPLSTNFALTIWPFKPVTRMQLACISFCRDGVMFLWNASAIAYSCSLHTRILSSTLHPIKVLVFFVQYFDHKRTFSPPNLVPTTQRVLRTSANAYNHNYIYLPNAKDFTVT